MFDYGHGYQMEDENDGYCTIMCHTTNRRYNNRLNYYSNPRLDGIVDGQKGIPGKTFSKSRFMGMNLFILRYNLINILSIFKGVSDNARVIIQNRFIMSKIGDESSMCSINSDNVRGR